MPKLIRHDPKRVTKTARKLARKHYGATDLYPEQRAMLRALAKGYDVLGIAPTGLGKSLVFQAFAKSTDALAVVITPLKALMRDQVIRARKKGFRAAYLASGDTESETALDDLKGLDLLYVSPERLRMHTFAKELRGVKIGLIAVDESHVLVDFSERHRPAYQFIGDFIDRISKGLGYRPPVLALTATATLEDREIIVEKLHMRPDYKAVVADPVRENLSYRVVTGNSWANIKTLVSSWRATGLVGRYIIYCGSRKSTEIVAASINNPTVIARAYHAGMVEKDRKKIEEAFAESRYKVIVATSAFGMGIDIPDIREVVFFGPSKSIEDFLQGVGRGGRDGLPCMGTMLYDQKGFAMQERLLQSSVPDDFLLETLWEYLSEQWKELGEDTLETSTYEIFEAMSKPGGNYHVPSINPYTLEPALLTLDSMGCLVYQNAESSQEIRADAGDIRDKLGSMKDSVKAVAEAILKKIPPGEQTHTFWFNVEELAKASHRSTRFVRRAIMALDSEWDVISVNRKYDRAMLRVNPEKQGLPATEVVNYESKNRYQAKLMRKLACVTEFAESGDYKAYLRKYFGYVPKEVTV